MVSRLFVKMSVTAEETVTTSWWSWKPTSERLLELAENNMFQAVRRTLKSYFVPISSDNELWTIETDTVSDRVPLVMIHGFGAGVGFWCLNLDSLSTNQNVYAVDLLGFGRSSRPAFPTDGAPAEQLFVDSLEEWRKKIGLEKFILLGHSFGGYLACSYSLAYPERVKHLILADPWGIPEKPPPGEENFEIPRWAKVVAAIISPFNPLAAVRVAGPWGPSLISKFRPDLQRKFHSVFGEEDERVTNYIYHLNAQYPSGESAFKALSIPYGWAKYPMIHRVKDIDAEIPMTVLFGSRSWMETTSGYTIKYLRQDSQVDVKIIKGAGHHIFIDKHQEFNETINNICDAMAAEEMNKEGINNEGMNNEERNNDGTNNEGMNNKEMNYEGMRNEKIHENLNDSAKTS